MSTKINNYESSTQEGMPVELYKFTCNDTTYRYTSKRENVSIIVYEDGNANTEIYYADYIKREDIEPGSQGNECDMTISVSKDNSIAKLFQATPPENPCDVEIMRLHLNDTTKYDIIYRGRVTQVSFEDTYCNVTVTLENWLNKELPNGIYQYYCNNILYDNNCRVKQADFTHNVFLDKDNDLVIYCDDFAKYPDGYFTNGKMYFDGQVRVIADHKGKTVTLRYPFLKKPRNNVTVTAGCDRLFSTCVNRFNNELNFTGCPYCPPTDTEKNPYGKGTYWVDGSVIIRDTDGYIGTISGV